MHNLTDDEIVGVLVAIVGDGFNRSLRALVDAGAVDRAAMDYRPGSRHYDLVTRAVELTARASVRSIRGLGTNDPDIDSRTRDVRIRSLTSD